MEVKMNGISVNEFLNQMSQNNFKTLAEGLGISQKDVRLLKKSGVENIFDRIDFICNGVKVCLVFANNKHGCHSPYLYVGDMYIDLNLLKTANDLIYKIIVEVRERMTN
jgi:DNA-binding Xre family transcriptional regulator